MKIAAVVDKDNRLKPLDQGEIIVIFEGKEDRKLLKNPGFGFKHGGKEKAMQLILEKGADAVLANKQFLCPCSYEMSLGRLKYILSESETLDQLVQNYANSSVKILSELGPELYAEEHHHKRHSLVNADLV